MRKIGGGSFGDIFIAINTLNGEVIAIEGVYYLFVMSSLV
jgi:hypothetical protein